MPHSSTKTRRSAFIRRASFRQRALRSSSRSAAGRDFFERQLQPLEGAAHGGRRDLHAALILEKLAVFGQGQVGVEADLGWQPPLQCLSLARRGSRDRLGLDLAGLPAQPKVTPYGRLGDAEDLRDFLPWHAAIDGGQHLQSQIPRIRFHAESLASRSTPTQAAVMPSFVPDYARR